MVDGEIMHDDGTHGPVPLSQASQAQQITAWLEVRRAQHPLLRFIAVDSASMMDDEHLLAADEWAKRAGVDLEEI